VYFKLLSLSTFYLLCKSISIFFIFSLIIQLLKIEIELKFGGKNIYNPLNQIKINILFNKMNIRITLEKQRKEHEKQREKQMKKDASPQFQIHMDD